MAYHGSFEELHGRLRDQGSTLTQLRTLAAEIGKDHDLANRLWALGEYRSRLLSLLILDLKQLDIVGIENLTHDIEAASIKEQMQLSDWLTANVIMKKTALKKQVATWQDSDSSLRQRIFWSYQARTVKDQTPAFQTALLSLLEERMETAPALVQENMNWYAAQLGILNQALRHRCIALGERLGLYKDYPVSKGCISPYLPIWIGEMTRQK